MRQLDTLTASRKDDGVVADHITTAYGVHANFLLLTLADLALAAVYGVLRIVHVAGLSQKLAQPFCGAAGSVDLLVVMHLDHFDIVIVTQDLRDLTAEREHQVHAHREVGREDQLAPIGSEIVDLFLLVFTESGGPQYDSAAGRHGRLRIADRQITGGEVDDYIGLMDQGVDIGGDGDAQLTTAGEHAGIFAHMRVVR